MQKHNIEEECPAEFCGEAIRDASKCSFKKASVHIAAAAAGLETKGQAAAARLKHEMRGVNAMTFTFRNYGMEALHHGSVNDPTNLPKIFGPDSPSDPDEARVTIKEMAAARGQVLTDE